MKVLKAAIWKLSIALALIFPAFPVTAGPILTWEFTPSKVEAGPNDVVNMNARLYNAPTATSSYRVPGALGFNFRRGTLFGDFTGFPPFYTGPNPYFLNITVGALAQSFSKKTIGPGESADFVVGTLTPEKGPVPEGEYSLGSFNIHFFGPDDSDKNLSRNLFTVEVDANRPDRDTCLLTGTACEPDPIENPPIDSSFVSKTLLPDGTLSDEFDSSLPTIVVTHGWQRDGAFEDPGIPGNQEAVFDAIIERLAEDVSANIVAYEWAGAYSGPINFLAAGRNAEPAGNKLAAELGSLLLSDGEYSQDIHLIGHSFGSVVNAHAADVLDKLGVATTQFTILDAPTATGIDSAPDLDPEWFEAKIPSSVNYIDSYYGNGANGGFGERMDFAAPNGGQILGYNHGEVFGTFYPDLVANGDAADTGTLVELGTGPPQGSPPLRVPDWITPVLSSYDSRPQPRFFERGKANRVRAIDVGLRAANDILLDGGFTVGAGLVTPISALPGLTDFVFDGIGLFENSPASIAQLLTVPSNARYLAFDYMFGNVGDGDWVTLHLAGEWLWSMKVGEELENVLLSALLDVSAFAGTTANLLISLNSVGEANAEFYFGNAAFVGTASIPEPGSVILFGAGVAILLGITWRQGRRRSG